MGLNATIQSKNVLWGKVTALRHPDKTLTKSGYAADAKVTGEALNARVKTADIVDNLESTSPYRPLSARQGAELKRQIDELRTLALGGE